MSPRRKQLLMWNILPWGLNEVITKGGAVIWHPIELCQCLCLQAASMRLAKKRRTCTFCFIFPPKSGSFMSAEKKKSIAMVRVWSTKGGGASTEVLWSFVTRLNPAISSVSAAPRYRWNEGNRLHPSPTLDMQLLTRENCCQRPTANVCNYPRCIPVTSANALIKESAQFRFCNLRNAFALVQTRLRDIALSVC